MQGMTSVATTFWAVRGGALSLRPGGVGAWRMLRAAAFTLLASGQMLAVPLHCQQAGDCMQGAYITHCLGLSCRAWQPTTLSLCPTLQQGCTRTHRPT